MTTPETQNSGTVTRQRAKVTIAKDNLSASIVLLKPEDHETDFSIEELLKSIEQAGVCFGVEQAQLEQAISKQTYGQPIKFAEGTSPQKGNDTQFKYNFETQREIKPTEDKDGRIDYRDMNFIQNVKKDGILITKMPPTVGVNGKGVDGNEIVAPRGRELPFKREENTVESEDGLQLIATTSGSIVYRNGSVSVKEVTVIPGNVDYSVGNLDCVGSIKINGDVLTGFIIKSGGDIEILGGVENSHIEAEGNIIVKGGCRGMEGGIIKANGDIVVKYAEGMKIEAGNDVIVGGELVNSQVIAKEHVQVKGRKGMIIGGDVKAGKEIRASILGSDAGTATSLSVAYDAELMNRYHKVVQESKRLTEDGKRVKESLVSLYRLQMDNKLDEKKLAILAQLEKFQKSLPDEINNLSEEKKQIEEKLREFKDAQIIGEGTIFPGVKVHFGLIYREIEEAMKSRRFTLEGSSITLSEWKVKKE